MKTLNRRLPCLVVAIALAIPAYAQQTGVIRGTISGFQGEPLAGAVARIEGGGGIQEFPTGADGTYTATLPAGSYTLTFLVQRQPLLTETNVPVRAGEELERNFDLSSLSDEEQQQALAMLEERGNAEAVRAAFDLGRAALTAGNFAEAVTQFEIAAESDDQHIILANLAQALSGAGRHADAAQQYQLALVQDPQNPVYLQNLGIALGNSGNVDGAIEAITQAATIDPAAASPGYYNLGIIFVNTGRLDDAANAFRQSIEADETNANAYYQLGLALVGTAPADAVEPLERFLELAPSDPNAATAQGLLDFARTQ